ncbi:MULTISPECIES: hypothetical protein [Xanthomonas]|uniref:hypothetical protein n=1 Tax=Xanthomonas TaxID=338 RepID=UPI0012902E42|nr:MULTISPECIES: hypothetical protein [Xanthomonas]
MTEIEFSENEVHEFIRSTEWSALFVPAPDLDFQVPSGVNEEIDEIQDEGGVEDESFELWEVLKARAMQKVKRLHFSVSDGRLVGSKIKLHVPDKKPMELDLIGLYEDGMFVVELKVKASAERNSFTELLGYSNYIAGLFPMTGRQDICNVLIANMQTGIARQAYLYDILINDRTTIVYNPVWKTDELLSLTLELYLPGDDDFKRFANSLLSHDAMSCVVASFDNIDGWIDDEEGGFGSLNAETQKNLSLLSAHAAQLMESENLHGFCFIRKPWKEIPRHYRNSIFICAINPFHENKSDDLTRFLSQLDDGGEDLQWLAGSGFHGRLLRLAKQVIEESLDGKVNYEREMPTWAYVVTNMQEVVFTHNLAFRPTGIFREAYVSYVESLYKNNLKDPGLHDLSTLKIKEINAWMRAWMFMEGCGLSG